MKTWILILTAMLSCLGVNAGESRTGTVSGTNPDAEVYFYTVTNDSYTIGATPSGGWIFTDAFSYPASNGWYQSGAHSASCEFIVGVTTVFVDAASIFSATISGSMYKPGGTGGSLVPWSVTGTGSGSASYTIDPTTAIIPVSATNGEYSQPYTYRVNGYTAPGGLWKTGGIYLNLGAINDFSSTNAGYFTLMAARNSNGAGLAFAEAWVVEVSSVATGSITSTTNSPGASETLIVPKGSSTIAITATPNPDIWPDGYPTWTPQTEANGSSTCSFNPSVAGEYTIAASCGASSKAIKIVVVEIKSLNREKTKTSRNAASGAPITVTSLHKTNTITVETSPAGYESYVTLSIPSGKGSISRDSSNNAKWVYTAPTEAQSDVGVDPTESFDVSCSIMSTIVSDTIKIHLSSVFKYFGTDDVDRNGAWQYAKWKYGISTANLTSITYLNTQSTAGLTSHYMYSSDKPMTLGSQAFSSEWCCASVLGHENVHGTQSYWFVRSQKEASEVQASAWELDHSNAPGCTSTPLTYIYTYDLPYYNDTKSYYLTNGGTVVYP